MGGGAATPVKLTYNKSTFAKLCRDQIDLLFKVLNVLMDLLAIIAHEHRAAAEVAKRVAEGEMKVQRDRLALMRLRQVRIAHMTEQVRILGR
jgi:hypothetical protein